MQKLSHLSQPNAKGLGFITNAHSVERVAHIRNKLRREATAVPEEEKARRKGLAQEESIPAPLAAAAAPAAAPAVDQPAVDDTATAGSADPCTKERDHATQA